MSTVGWDEVLARVQAFRADDRDPETIAELDALMQRDDAEARAELQDRFGTTLRFGTAGLRGRMGAGTARMNSVVVQRASWGLGKYLRACYPNDERINVVIAFDGRRNSRKFSEDAAGVLAALGIGVSLFADPVPTPVCAFAVTATEAHAGIMVTASHNPPADNGYKVYWRNGAQIIPPHDTGIAEWIAKVGRALPTADPFDAVAEGLRTMVPPEVGERYLEEIAEAGWHGPAGRDQIGIVYTAMHGVGHHWVRRALHDAGFPKVISVPAQADPDGRFETVSFPNPEEPGALDRALALADASHPDLIFANDPDADRISVTTRARRGSAGAWVTLSGNDVGVLLGYDAIKHAPPDRRGLVITTLVSSTALGRIAADLDVDYAETLTGFKWIANTAMGLEERDGVRFLMGYEEALGVSVGDLVRDKDGVSAILRVAELAAHLRATDPDRTLLDLLDEIAVAHGLSASLQWSQTRSGSEGAAAIAACMATLRTAPPTHLDGDPVVRCVDLAADPAPGFTGADSAAVRCARVPHRGADPADGPAQRHRAQDQAVPRGGGAPRRHRRPGEGPRRSRSPPRADPGRGGRGPWAVAHSPRGSGGSDRWWRSRW